MALVLTEEQTLLKDTAAQFFQEKVPVANFRKLRDEKSEKGYDPAVWKEAANLGFAGIMVPEQYGGTEFGPVGLGLVLEQAGRTLAATPLLSTAVVACAALQQGGTSAQRQKYLPLIASGEIIMTLALEEGAHHNPTRITTKAEAAGDNFKLTGKKVFVLDGHVADVLIVAARTSGGEGDANGITLFLVEKDAPGLKVTRTIMTDHRNAAIVELDGVSVPAANVLGSVDGGWDVLEPALDVGRIGIAAETLGLVQEVFDTTVQYLKDRKQFGKVIGSFQALQHRAAELFCEVELCRSVVLEALSALEERRNDVPKLASLAKARLAEASRLITNEGLQMHGGVGMTDEFDVGLFMKRARVAAVTFGDANYHRNRYAELDGY
ncbi:acyl-CoA dehydrogenase family protein [Tepidicaulis sp. LMO-SS28]|uniref:acyl-CoA dehydrogenase family protein n=1 Tax=Tepidicaulis sp. LMO-SS28 TaxID=3447455 RepID=UPI003EE360CA